MAKKSRKFVGNVNHQIIHENAVGRDFSEMLSSVFVISQIIDFMFFLEKILML